MTVRVLGPLDVGDPSLSPRERTLLSALIVRIGSSLAPAELADALWQEDAPTTWAAQVKTSVARIRSRLGPDAIITHGSTYTLGISPDAIDAVRFERLVSSARQHALHGQHDRATDAYDRALALWRGRPLPDVADWEPGAVEALRLEEIRADAEEERLEAQLRAGAARGAIPEAERLVRQAPLREERWALLAWANYRAGRQADALAALRAARARLIEELGVEPSPRLDELETAILRQDPELLAGIDSREVSNECPYRGLDAFGTDDADTYFGREADLELLLERVRPGTILTIAGPSGSGKSSLALAGVLPRLSSGRRRYAVVRPGVHGLPALRAAVARDGVDVIVVDQTEELLRSDAAEAAAFCEICARFVADGGMVICTIRSDLLDQATALPAIGSVLGRGVYALAPLTSEAFREVIELPAARAGLRLEPGLVELIVRDAAERVASLPLVSYALVETWARREGHTLTIDGYKAAGGLGGAIASAAESAYQTLDEEQREVCRLLLLRLVERDSEGVTRRRHPVAAPLMADPARRAVIERLIATRLVTTEGDSVVIAHEAVASAWPRLNGWLEEDVRGARTLALVSTQADAWSADGRPGDQLLRGGRLALVREWREQTAPDLTDLERDYVDASEAKHQDRAHELEARARRDHRQNRRLRTSLISASALLVVAVIAGGIATARSEDAAAAAKDEQIQAITSRSLALRSTNRDIAALMAVAAMQTAPGDPRSRAALAGTITAAGGFTGPTVIKDATWHISAWPIPGTRRAVVVRDQVNIEIDDLDSGARLRTLSTRLPRPNTQVRPWVRVSADGSTILIVQHFNGPDPTNPYQGYYERAWFFDALTGALIGKPLRVDDALSESVALSSDGHFATWATIGPLVVLDRDRGTVRVRRGLSPVDWNVDSAASTFDRSGRILMASRTGDEYLIDPTTLRTVSHRHLDGGDSMGHYVSIADDGTVLHQGVAGLMATTAAGTVLWRHPFDREAECSRSAVSSESAVAACTDEDGQIEVRDLRTGKLRMPTAVYQLSASGDLVFAPDGSEMLLMSALAPVIGHLRVDGSGPASTAIAAGYRLSGDFDPGGRRLLVEKATATPAGAQRSFAVWDVGADRAVFRIPQDVRSTYSGIIDGPMWVTANTVLVLNVIKPGTAEERTVSLALDLSTGTLRPTGIDDGAASVYRSLDGALLYAAEDRGIVVIDGKTLRPTGKIYDAHGEILTVSDDSAHTRVAVTLYNDTTNALETVVFDGRTGRRLADGLPTYGATAMIDDRRLLGAGIFALGSFDATTLTPGRALPRVPGSSLIDVSSDSRTALVIGNGDHGAQVLDTRSYTPLGDGMAAAVDTVGALSPDGSLAATMPIGSGIVIHHLDAKTELTAACRLAAREPTAEEWKTYFGGLGPQHPLCPVN